MNVAILTPFYPPARRSGGVSACAHALAAGLARHGETVTVVTSDLDGTKRIPPQEIAAFDPQGVTVRALRTNPLPFQFTPGLRKTLANACRDADILVSVSNLWLHSFVVAHRVSLRCGIPHAVYPHGLLDSAAYHIKHLRKAAALAAYGKRYLNGSARIVALNEAESRDIAFNGITAPISILPNGIDPGSFREHDDRAALEKRFAQLRGKEFVLYLGRIHPKKDVELLIRSFQAASITAPGLLVIAGDGDPAYVESVRRVASNGSPAEVLFVGPVSGPLKNGLLKAARVFALTSRGEGMPVAALEAMACGRPVILTEQCNMPEVARAEAGWVMPRDQAAITAALVTALSDETEADRRGGRARELVEREYTWEQVIGRAQALFREIVAARKS